MKFAYFLALLVSFHALHVSGQCNTSAWASITAPSTAQMRADSWPSSRRCWRVGTRRSGRLFESQLAEKKAESKAKSKEGFPVGPGKPSSSESTEREGEGHIPPPCSSGINSTGSPSASPAGISTAASVASAPGSSIQRQAIHHAITTR